MLQRQYGLQCRNNASVAICSDSHAALKALITGKINSALVAETVSALMELSLYNSVRLVWTPGHCGIQGNEMADSLSGQASATKYTGPEPVQVFASKRQGRSLISTLALLQNVLMFFFVFQ